MAKAIKIDLNGAKPAKVMRPNMVVPKGSDRPRLPKGYEAPSSCIGDICPGCGDDD
jgi:hypothetical protein